MASPRHLLALLSALSYISCTYGGPLGPLPNITSADVGLKEGGCALGDVVYLPGDEVPGAGPCERCTCGARGVRCAPLECAPRPGCKALHRPDHCCPTYQCECEQEGRVYGNGEKLVDPKDPCRVCYCQGGEVVCRRIACFVRDDCTPRRVPGRCCPEYDDCPLRGVTSIPGPTPPPVSPASVAMEQSPAPSPPKEVKQEITIKEITPVSEIPIITNVKIKEILPSPSIEVAEYSSSKSPLIPREATSEKPSVTEKSNVGYEGPSVVEIHSSPELTPLDDSKTKDENESVDDTPPSKISLSTQDSIINSEIYPSNVPIVATMGVPPVPAAPVPTETTKAPIIEEEDTSFLEHNPAFPPLPDDLSVLSSHGDELVPEPSAETDHMPMEHAHTPAVVTASATQRPDEEAKEPMTTTTEAPTETHASTASSVQTETYPSTTSKIETETLATTTEQALDWSTETRTPSRLETTSTTGVNNGKGNPALNLRSAIATEIMSTTSERETDEVLSKSTIENPTSTISASIAKVTTEISSNIDIFAKDHTVELKKLEELATEQDPSLSTSSDETSTEFVQSDAPKTSQEFTTDEPETPLERVSFVPSSSETDFDTTTIRAETVPSAIGSHAQEHTTSSVAKSNAATEVTSRTEFSSLPVETSDQNPHEASENVSKATLETSTTDLPSTARIDKTVPLVPEVITVSKSDEKRVADNVETTEFILKPFVSAEESTTDVESIKIAGDSETGTPAPTTAAPDAALLDADANKIALTDLIRLVSDVASISDHTEAPATALPPLTTTISDSEELIPVNAGYKSKNSNFNQNSITEVPSKSKTGPPANKQKTVEIEDDDDSEAVTDAAPPHDKAEPTTRRAIIDNVSAEPAAPATADNKDIEIITQSYVPTINKRPTKVVLQEEAPSPSSGPATTAAAPH